VRHSAAIAAARQTAAVGIRIGEPSLVVLVGAAGCGKSTWAGRWFRAEAIVSSDDLRGVVGHSARDQRASKDAFEVLDLIVTKRLKRRLTTVVDTTGLDAKQRAKWVAMAAKAGVPAVAVTFDLPEREVRARNRQRGDDAVPSAVVTSQLQSAAETFARIQSEGFAAIHEHDDVVLVPARFVDALVDGRRQEEDPVPMRFGLQIGKFAWPGGAAELAPRLATIARAAEDAGFSSLSVMDHFVQIPPVGPEWEDIPESTTTLGFLAASTSTIRLGALVHGITYRNIAHLGKLTATLDVLSGGRAFCGIGAAWFEREHQLYGWEFPPAAQRYAALEDALELLPLLWGKGAPRFEGRTVTVPEAVCYPRPLQERIPILVGGSGENRTLRLVARHADACNLFGDPDVIRHKIEVLHRHCEAEGRDPGSITVTQFGEASVVEPGDHRYADVCGTVDEQIGRYRALADAGVQEAIVALHLDGTIGQIERFEGVIAAFR
jgi:F420-dependent oxidoreductase-like protein